MTKLPDAPEQLPGNKRQDKIIEREGGPMGFGPNPST
jgi:hypothetical protein